MEFTISPRRAFQIGFIVSALLAGAYLALLLMSIGASGPSEANVIQTSISGSGEGAILHRDASAGDEVGFKGASIDYSYSKTTNNHDASGVQSSELILTGGDGSYWNRYAVQTTRAVAGGHEVKYFVNQIEGSFYAKSGMNVSFSEADGREQLTSEIQIEAQNASIQIDVVGGDGKPVDLERVELVGQFVVDQLVVLEEPLKTNDDWLGFCEALNNDIKELDPDGGGVYLAPQRVAVVTNESK